MQTQGERERERSEDAMLLALREEGVRSQGIQVASRTGRK